MEKFSFYQEKVVKSFEKVRYAKDPLELYEPIDYVLSMGGKRIRPSLLLTAYHMFDDNLDYALHAALAIEVFHNFTLLHDDIMDKADIRRNKPTVHKKWNESVAILSGDAMMIKSYDLLFTYPFEQLKEIMRIFNQTALYVCEGQQYDMNFQSSSLVEVDDYLMMIELKTAVLIAASLQIGALLGGADADTAKKLYDFGKNIGIAFQLQDDLLDVYADQDKFGKTTGGDIVENKKTFLLLSLLDAANESDRKTIDDWLLKKEFASSEKIKQITAFYDQYKIKPRTEERIKHFFDSSIAQLEKIDLPRESKSTLYEFSELLFQRMK